MYIICVCPVLRPLLTQSAQPEKSEIVHLGSKMENKRIAAVVPNSCYQTGFSPTLHISFLWEFLVKILIGTSSQQQQLTATIESLFFSFFFLINLVFYCAACLLPL